MSDQDKKQLMANIDAALDDIRPHLAVDGGDVKVVDVTEDMRIKVQWLGSCETCNMSTMTMRAGVEQAIKNKIPGIASVEAINGMTV